MTRFPTLLITLFLFAAGATSVHAEWFDDYDAGLVAAEKRNWGEVVQKMTAAIAKKPREGVREKTYGTIMIAYHPYYYRGVAQYNLGEYQKAISDLEKTTGIGRVKLESAETVISKAQAKLAPPPTLPPPPPPPAQPTIDPSLAPARTRAQAELVSARRAKSEAEDHQAPSLAAQPFLKATEALVEAQTRESTARTTDEWQRVFELATRSRGLFESAESLAQTKIASSRPPPPPATTTQPPSTTSSSTSPDARARAQLKSALNDYFKGNYSEAARDLTQLTSKELRGNAMAWAILGASQYSQYYLEGEQNVANRRAAEESFRRAKRLSSRFKLSTAYFSPRIRGFFDTLK